MQNSKKTYLSFFFLLCFILSFSLSTAQQFSLKVCKTVSVNEKSLSFSCSDNPFKTTGDFLFEENENETENDFQAQAFILPFFISCFQYNFVPSEQFSAIAIVEKPTNPIYIRVCNFRI